MYRKWLTRFAKNLHDPVVRGQVMALMGGKLIGLVLVLSVDWFIGMARALGNLIGNCVATVVIAAWEKDLDHAKAKEVLYGKFIVDVTAG